MKKGGGEKEQKAIYEAMKKMKIKNIDKNIIKIIDKKKIDKEAKDVKKYLKKHNNNWIDISIKEKLSEDFIRTFHNKVHWEFISIYQKLSEDFIREFRHKLNLDNIIKNQKVNKNFRECLKWEKNKSKNPKTGRKIKINGPTYKKIKKKCYPKPKKITVKELRKICKEKGIKGYSKLRKKELEKKCL